MKELAFQETTINANGQQFVRVQEYEWDEDGVKTNVKNGFIEVKAGKGADIVEKLKAKKAQAIFGQFNRQQGLYQVTYLRNPEPAHEGAASPKSEKTLETA